MISDPLLWVTLRRRSGSLARCGLAPLAAGGLLLGGGRALAGGLPSVARARALPSPARGSRRVGDLGRALLRHPLLAQAFVLVLVLDAWPLVWHRASFRTHRRTTTSLLSSLPGRADT